MKYGYHCYKDGTSYWGIALAYTVPIVKSFHLLPKEYKRQALARRFESMFGRDA